MSAAGDDSRFSEADLRAALTILGLARVTAPARPGEFHGPDGLPAHPDQANRRLVLLLQSVSVELADRLAGAASAREVLHLAVAYKPPADEYASAGWTLAPTVADGTALRVRWMTRPAFSDTDIPLPLPLQTVQRRGVAHKAEGPARR